MSKVVVLGAEWCPFCVKVKNYLSNNKVPTEWIDTDQAEGNKKR